MIEHHLSQHARRIGDYLGCSPEFTASVLREQHRAHDAKPAVRFGEIVAGWKAISDKELAAAIQQQRIDRLRSCTVFSHLNKRHLIRLSQDVEENTVEPGETFIQQDARESDLFVLGSGLVEVFCTDASGDEVPVAVVFPGEPIGEMAYFCQGVRSTSVRALERSVLLRLPYEKLSSYFETVPDAASPFVSVVSERLKHTNNLYQRSHRGINGSKAAHHAGAPGRPAPADVVSLPQALEIGIESLIGSLTESACELTDADCGSLYIVDSARRQLWTNIEVRGKQTEIRVPLGRGIVGWVARNREIANVADASQDDRFNHEVDERTGYHTTTLLCVPVLDSAGSVLAVLEVINKRTGLFNDEDERFLRSFSRPAGVALANIDLFRQLLLVYQRTGD